MTLLEVKHIIDSIALSQPNINTVVCTGNVFDLNTNNYTVRYSAFCAQQEVHHQTDSFISYGFTLFYVDRLTDEKKNKLEVQSTGIQVLNNIINTLKEHKLMHPNDSVDYTTFTERFAAECAGVFARVYIMVPIDTCMEDYGLGEFNYDFSDDFYIKK